jgi:hypothetical protein
MKRIYVYVVALLTIGGFASCDKNFVTMEEPNEYQTAASAVTNITSEALPGQIQLRWDVPADKNYYFLRVSYHDPLTKTDKSVLASPGSNSLLIDNTRARYGDYEFKFQTFNRKDEGGQVQSFKARSGNAPIVETMTITEVALSGSQLSTNNQEPSEGPIGNLVDDNNNTFFHTRWSAPTIPMPQWIQVELFEPLQAFRFYTRNRNGSQEAPAEVEVQISNDGVEWTMLETITSGIPSGSQGEYTSAVYRPDAPFTFFRYNVLRTNANRNYFNLARFELYDVEINVYNPETDEAEI